MPPHFDEVGRDPRLEPLYSQLAQVLGLVAHAPYAVLQAARDLARPDANIVASRGGGPPIGLVWLVAAREIK